MTNIKKNQKKWIAIMVILLLVIGIVIFIYYKHHKTNVIVQTKPVANIKQIKPTQANNVVPKKITPSNTSNQGTSTNTSSCTNMSSSNQLIQSQSGVISVKSPALNSIIKSGFAICGTSSLNQINYRLIDNGAGVISQGLINVSGHKFSATISFPAHNDSGRLDIYSLNNDGSEINDVQIPVKF